MSAHSRHSKTFLRVAALSCVATLSGFGAHACQLETELPAIDLVIDFDVYAFEVAAAGTSLNLANNGESECRVLITVETDALAPPPFALPGADVSANISLPAAEGVIGEGSDPLHSGQTLLVIPPGSDRTETLDVFIDNFVSVPAGSYTTNFRFTAEVVDGGEMAETIDGSVTLIAAPRAQVNIAGTSASFGESTFNESVHFENPQAGDTRDLFIQTRSNALTTLTINSEHGGRMVRPDLPDSWISYGATLDGEPLDMENGATISGRPMTDLSGTSIPLQLEILDFEKAFAGDYEDTIYVNITAY